MFSNEYVPSDSVDLLTPLSSKQEKNKASQAANKQTPAHIKTLPAPLTPFF
jgi:hypothetical protein